MRHKGPIAERVIAGAYAAFEGCEQARSHRDGMRAVVLDAAEQVAFAPAALSLKDESDLCGRRL